MSAFGADTVKSPFGKVWQELAFWGRTDGLDWIFVFKIILAAFLAMWISMQLRLDQPRTAMMTAVIVMQQQTGLVLVKSIYRIGATIAGILVGLLLLGLFAQEPVLYVLGLAVWVGLCTAGSAFYRNFRSYGCVLAGYSAAMMGQFSIPEPMTFFSIASTRLTEITLGILCAGVVSDVVFPRRLSDAITSNVQNRYMEFIAFIRASLSGAAGRAELDSMRLRLVGNVLSLESIRSNAVLEDPEVRGRDLRLRKLNSEFMAVTTTFSSFQHLLKRLTKNATPAGQALTGLWESFGETVVTKGEIPANADAAHQAARRIAAFRAVLGRRIEEVRKNIAADGDPQTVLDFATAVELLHRFLRELHAYTQTYATLPSAENEPNTPDDIDFSVRTDPVVALLSGGRAFVGIIVIGWFWIASAWPYGTSALTFVAIASALFASAPDPSRNTNRMFIGHLSGLVAAFVYKFLVMPDMDGFALLCASMIPFLMVGLYIRTRPGLVDIGFGYTVFFIQMTNPSNTMQFNPVDFINDGCGVLVGVVVAGVMYRTMIPVAGSWLKQRLARQIRHQVIMACFDPLAGLRNRFESGTRDLLHKQAAVQKIENEQDRRLLALMFSVVEIGRAVIHLRQDAGSLRMPQPLADSVQEGLSSTALFFRRPSATFHDAALDRVTNAIKTICLETESAAACVCPQNVLNRMLTSLHLIRTALLDEDVLVAVTVDSPSTNLLGVIPHAA
ncbi:FUSC family protein [Oryzomonas rubra]|uniref:FUSC family protein n=1 Tax=Oryzomonas rubra TaxID=2509454 RepID=A0A5A9X9H6_9BACT|nr:FUSC family protein [Oryzomonas rubra]KAA0889098.1 FUSC family protein [Oryzomonas rubra]